MCMFRNNGWYSFIVILPFTVFLMWKKRKDACATLLIILFSAIIIRNPLFSLCHVADPDIVESLSIPLQQVANTIYNDGEIKAEESELLSRIIDIDKVAEKYDCHCSDNIKNLIREKGNEEYLKKNKSDYFRLWVKLGIRHPGFYLQAFVNQTEGYYNPDIQRYQYVQGVWDTQMPIFNTPLLPEWICKILNFYVSDWLYYIPILGLIKSIGFHVWILFALFGYILQKRDYAKAILLLPLFACWGTLIIATPVYAEFRYIYSLILCLPILWGITFNKSSEPE